MFFWFLDIAITAVYLKEQSLHTFNVSPVPELKIILDSLLAPGFNPYIARGEGIVQGLN